MGPEALELPLVSLSLHWVLFAHLGGARHSLGFWASGVGERQADTMDNTGGGLGGRGPRGVSPASPGGQKRQAEPQEPGEALCMGDRRGVGAGGVEGRVGRAGVRLGSWEQGPPGHTSAGSGSRARLARGLGGKAEGDTCSPGAAGASDSGRGSRGRLWCWLEGGPRRSAWSQEAGGLENRIQD